MKEIFSLLVALVWPSFILLLLYLGRKSILPILEAIRTRIESGDAFEAGTSGVKLGRSTTGYVSKTNSHTVMRVDGVSEKVLIADKKQDENHPKEESQEKSEQEVPSVYIVHKARRNKSLDSGGYEYYNLRIFLEIDEEEDLSRISHVVYHLHPSFPKPDRIIRDRDTQFELRTSAWGQFNLTADVYLKSYDKPLKLERYLNF
jgi:hypothetical protein